jgi:putative hemolysin
MSSSAKSTMARNTEVLALKMSAKRLPRPLLEAARRTLHGLLGFQRFNAIYGELPPYTPADFSRTFLDAMRVHVELAGLPIDAIPAAGSLIVIANHPFGLIEGMALDALLLARRPDVTGMVTYRLAAIPEYRDRLIFVDPQRKRHRRKLNAQGWRRSFQWLARGGALVLFPAGRVAGFQWRRMSIADQPWSSHVAAIARRTRAPVLPVYFHGHNGWAFQLATTLGPSALQDLLLVGEFTNKCGLALRATVGRLIEPDELSRFATDGEVIGFFRQETERLARSPPDRVKAAP